MYIYSLIDRDLVRWAEAVALGFALAGFSLRKRRPCRRASSTVLQGILPGRMATRGPGVQHRRVRPGADPADPGHLERQRPAGRDLRLRDVPLGVSPQVNRGWPVRRRGPWSGAGDERLRVAGAVEVGAAGGAVPRRAARHRFDGGVAAGAQDGGAWHLDRAPVVPVSLNGRAAIRVALEKSSLAGS